MGRLTFCVYISIILGGLSLICPFAHAQPYPNRQVKLVVPMVAGAAMDISGRMIANELQATLKQPIIVLNKPGASTTLGTDFVVKSDKDGYTLLYANTSSIVYAKASNPGDVPYDPFEDLEPLGLHCFFPVVVAVRADSPWKTFAELVEYGKKNPGKVRASTPGIGTTLHFDLEITQSLTGAEFTHVPFKGSQSAALLGGHVELIYDAFSLSLPHYQSGDFRFLLITKKMPGFPEIPTITELGYKQYLPSAWLAFYAPTGVPQEVKNVLVPAIQRAINKPEIKSKIESMQYIVDYTSPNELKKMSMEEYETACAIAERIGLRKKAK